MPGKIARSDPRPSVRVTRGAGSGPKGSSPMIVPRPRMRRPGRGMHVRRTSSSTRAKHYREIVVDP
jgi:hypothetical protein